jgi:hypothetical protein
MDSQCDLNLLPSPAPVLISSLLPVFSSLHIHWPFCPLPKPHFRLRLADHRCPKRLAPSSWVGGCTDNWSLVIALARYLTLSSLPSSLFLSLSRSAQFSPLPLLCPPFGPFPTPSPPALIDSDSARVPHQQPGVPLFPSTDLQLASDPATSFPQALLSTLSPDRLFFDISQPVSSYLSSPHPIIPPRDPCPPSSSALRSGLRSIPRALRITPSGEC